jgi:hypothetical protein
MGMAWVTSYHPAPAALVGGLAALVVGLRERSSGRSQMDAPLVPRATPVAIVVCLVAVGFAAATMRNVSEHVYVDRDPAVYNNTAIWISANHGLIADDALDAFRADDLRRESAGAFRAGDGLEFQFNHFTGGLLAVAHDVGGLSLMFRMSAFTTAAGLLAVYAVAARCIRRPLVAALAPLSLACIMPFVAVARDSYSEPFALLMLWTAALVLLRCHEHWSRSSALLGGVLLGSVCVVRIDGAVYLAPAVLLVALAFRARAGRPARWIAAGIVGAGAIAAIDLIGFARGYARHLRDELTMMLGALVAAAAVAIVSPLIADRRRRLGERINWKVLACCASLATTAAFALAWWVRPASVVSRADHAMYMVEILQRAEGARIDPTRDYAESAVPRLAWYLGVSGLLVAIAGVGVVAYSVVARRGRTPLAALLTILVGGSLYLWRPSINPDHIWATRRLVPALYPALVVCGCVGIDRALEHVRRPFQRSVILALGASALILPAASATWPVRAQREQAGFSSIVHQACDLLGPDAAVVVLGAESAVRIPMTLRSACDVPVVSAGPTVDAERLGRLAAEVAAEGRRLVAVTAERTAAEPLRRALSGVRSTATAVNGHQLAKSIERRPQSYVTETLQFWVFDVDAE